jgi:hypothetical protein
VTEQEIIAALEHSKLLYAAVSGIVTLLLGRTKLAPFKDDMPVPIKTILVCLAIAEILLLDHIKAAVAQTWLMTGLAVSILVFLLVYLGTYLLFGYHKILPVPSGGWFRKKLAYTDVKILGGIRLTPQALNARTRGRNPQQFLEDNQYDQDAVWTRWSRLPVQIAVVLSYVLLVVSLVGVVAVGAGI